jgi:hypothetical protein
VDRGLFQCAPYAMALATQSGRLIEANSIFMHYFNVTVKVLVSILTSVPN